MGFNASWLAVRGMTPEKVLATLRLERSGEVEEVPESHVTGILLPGGWFLVYANHFDFADRAPLFELSGGAEVVTCAVEEHVTVSAASGWKDGLEVWAVVHDSREGLGHLKAAGQLPPEFRAIRERLTGEQAEAGGDDSDVDYVFDVPVELAFALTGFRHDQYVEGARFERLKSAGGGG